jgi:hypothetical protein
VARLGVGVGLDGGGSVAIGAVRLGVVRREREGRCVGVGGGGVGCWDLAEEATPVVSHDGLCRAELLVATDAKLDGVAPRLQRGQGPREAPLHPSVGLVEAPIQLGDLVEDELDVERTHADGYRTEDRCL